VNKLLKGFRNELQPNHNKFERERVLTPHRKRDAQHCPELIANLMGALAYLIVQICLSGSVSVVFDAGNGYFSQLSSCAKIHDS
jgi:hypothetical protein